jgi:hypothetical protein
MSRKEESSCGIELLKQKLKKNIHRWGISYSGFSGIREETSKIMEVLITTEYMNSKTDVKNSERKDSQKIKS